MAIFHHKTDDGPRKLQMNDFVRLIGSNFYIPIEHIGFQLNRTCYYFLNARLSNLYLETMYAFFQIVYYFIHRSNNWHHTYAIYYITNLFVLKEKIVIVLGSTYV